MQLCSLLLFVPLLRFLPHKNMISGAVETKRKNFQGASSLAPKSMKSYLET